MSSNRAKARIGINAVAMMVEGDWKCGWQEYAAQNDDAIDGIILMRRGSKAPSDTGGIVFVQVKTGEGYRQDQKQYPNHIGVQLGKKHISQHFARWQQTPGPAVLIFVDDTMGGLLPRAWWTDLKSPESYSSTNDGMILVPKQQRFARHTKGAFHKLCGAVQRTGISKRFESAGLICSFLDWGKENPYVTMPGSIIKNGEVGSLLE